MLEILCLECVLDDPLGYGNPRNTLERKTLLKIGEHGLLPSAMRTWRWAFLRSFDFVYASRESKKP